MICDVGVDFLLLIFHLTVRWPCLSCIHMICMRCLSCNSTSDICIATCVRSIVSHSVFVIIFFSGYKHGTVV